MFGFKWIKETFNHVFDAITEIVKMLAVIDKRLRKLEEAAEEEALAEKLKGVMLVLAPEEIKVAAEDLKKEIFLS